MSDSLTRTIDDHTVPAAGTYAVDATHSSASFQVRHMGLSTVRGSVDITEATVEIAADLGGLTPGQHGFHIHQYGDCSAPDGTSAGGHYNPAGVAHGNATDAQRHVGDLGNISANSDGVAAYRRIDHQIQLNGPESIIGRGVIVHEKPDQFSQPTGAAGGRVACGAIAIRQP